MRGLASDEFYDLVMKHSDLPGYDEPNSVFLPIIDIQEIQRNLMFSRIKSERNYDILADAISRSRSVEESLSELSEVNAGLGRYLPRTKDEVHNERVDEMVDLVGSRYNLNNLKKRGVFSPKCPLVLLPYATAISAGMYAGGASLGGDSSVSTATIIGAVTGAVLGLSGFFSAVNNKNLPWDNAKYLDQKVSELF